ncbi:MAG: sugar phosphate isomerase/epimerase [Verrucomicrobiales bacterium]|nr:sugar phosphate isomerase/epimerase [Verrucomicrobiales bacterium]
MSTAKLNIERRQFLATLGTAGALAALAGTSAASSAAPLPAGQWKTAVGLNGFQSGTHKYKRQFPIWEVLDFAAREGFDGIELVGDWPQGGYPASTESERLRALRRLYDGFGLRIFSIQLGAEGAFSPVAAERDRWLAEARDRLQLAKSLGASCTGLWPGGGLRGQTLDEALKQLTNTFREAAKIAQDLGILLAFEIEPPFVFRTEEHVHRILAETGHPNFKVIYDPSHFDVMNGSTGKPHEMLKRVGVANVGYLHLTDTDGTLRDGGTSKHLAAGEGHANLMESFRVLREGGFNGWIMIDSWEIPDPYDACRKGLRMIREAMR